MSVKYVAGEFSVNTTVRSSFATTPGSGVASMYFLIDGASWPASANPSQNCLKPAMRSWKSGRPPNGWAGLQLRLTPITASAAVTWRGGLVFHCTPCLMVSVYVLPSALTPPFSVVGSASAMSGCAVSFLAGSAGKSKNWRLRSRITEYPAE